ncbi:MAG: 4-hydroxy-tetrahydrodipicolinate reductase [Candidatus Eremiobacteraeota bacterium]|nr:4-hydroxy-tetrahydrodipicolinate reductase [Candidatus Eremiobacteraeota bacterium]
MEKIKVLVCGAAGKMGRQTVKTILQRDNIELVAAVDTTENAGKDAGELATGKKIGIKIEDSAEKVFKKEKIDVMVDFTNGKASPVNMSAAIFAGCACVVGSTGISQESIDDIRKKSEETGVPVLIAPNFSLGAVLMMRFSKSAAKYFEWAEIIELHHENKIDAPSGTAIRTADLMAQNRETFNSPPAETEKIPGVRGGIRNGIRIHSVRMPGFLAHQEVNLGGVGEVLKIRHDSISRECFMSGVMLAIEKVRDLSGMVVGLENILE